MPTSRTPADLFDSLPDDHPMFGCDDEGREDEGDELADPFVILAAKEERAGVPLFYLTKELNS